MFDAAFPAETTPAAETAGNVSAETIDPSANENVSAETSADEPDAEIPAPVRTGRAAALVHIAEHYLATVETGFDHAASNIAHRSSSRGRRSARKSAGACPVVERQLKEPNSTSALEKVRVPLSGWA